jgi:hypothetical protein
MSSKNKSDIYPYGYLYKLHYNINNIDYDYIGSTVNYPERINAHCSTSAAPQIKYMTKHFGLPKDNIVETYNNINRQALYDIEVPYIKKHAPYLNQEHSTCYVPCNICKEKTLFHSLDDHLFSNHNIYQNKLITTDTKLKIIKNNQIIKLQYFTLSIIDQLLIYFKNIYFKLNCQHCEQQFNIHEKQSHYENYHKICYRYIHVHSNDTFIIDTKYQSTFDTIYQSLQNNEFIKLAPYQWSPSKTIKNNLPMIIVNDVLFEDSNDVEPFLINIINQCIESNIISKQDIQNILSPGFYHIRLYNDVFQFNILKNHLEKISTN